LHYFKPARGSNQRRIEIVLLTYLLDLELPAALRYSQSLAQTTQWLYPLMPACFIRHILYSNYLRVLYISYIILVGVIDHKSDPIFLTVITSGTAEKRREPIKQLRCYENSPGGNHLRRGGRQGAECVTRRLEPAARLLFQKRFNDVARRRASLFS